ncbi:hypothetical protein VIGAN_09094900, partial [Vigna angularis var. angularis]
QYTHFSLQRFLRLQQRYLGRAREARHRLPLRTRARALPRVSLVGEFLHGNNRDYLSGESSAAGAVKLLVELVAEEGSGIGDKAMVLLNSWRGLRRERRRSRKNVV